MPSTFDTDAYLRQSYGHYRDWKPCPTTDSGCPCPNHLLPTYPVGAPDNFNDDPTFHHLTHTNNNPLSAEQTTISSMITDLEEAMVNIDASAEQLKAHRAVCEARLSALDIQLKNLANERARLSDAIHHRKVILSPLRRLPSEILQHIFIQTFDFPVDEEDEGFHYVEDGEWYDYAEVDSPLWTLELVCKKWRADIIVDPYLWSFIDIIVSPTSFSKDQPRYISRIARQIGRAQLSPLSVCIRRCSSFAMTELPDALVFLLLPNAHRIRDLHLYLPLRLLSGLSLLKTHLQALVYLSICNTPFDNDDQPTAIPLFDQCHLLERLDTKDIVSPALAISIPWESLREFNSSNACISFPRIFAPSSRPHDIRLTLTKAKRLKSVYLELDSPSLPPYFPGLLTCQYVVSMTIICLRHPRQQHALPQLFQGLALPSLENLTISLWGASPTPDRVMNKDAFAVVAGVIERSKCPLQELRYGGGVLDAQDVVRVFQAAPTIHTFEPRWTGTKQCPANLTDIIRAFTLLPNGDIIAPQLRVLEFVGRFVTESGAFLAMVRSRASLAPLEKIDINWWRSDIFSREDAEGELAALKEGIKDLCSAGLTFVYRVA